MINSFYTLRALIEEWKGRLEGAVLTDAFSQEAGELTLSFAGPGEDTEQSVRIGVERPLLFALRSDGASKARRNVATLFARAHGRCVERVHIARRDRQFFFRLAAGPSEASLFFHVMLFGAQANVFLVGEGPEGARVVEAFRGNAEHAGQPAPEPQPAPMPDRFEQFEARWQAGRGTLAQAVSAATPLFGRTLAEEVVFRAGVEDGPPGDCTRDERRHLFEAVQVLRAELCAPAPRIYAEGWEAGTFALVALRHRGEAPADVFATVDEAARVYVRRRLAERRYAALKKPLEEALLQAVERQDRTIESLEGQLKGAPRADRYERYGHLLKAQPHQVEAGADEAVLPDYFAGAAAGADMPKVRIPLKAELSAMQNAERYYEKARGARTARAKAGERLGRARREKRRAERLLKELRAADTLKKLRRFRREREDALAAFTTGRGERAKTPSFRRFTLKGGYEIWAGKNARQNHDLTFHHAQKYDLWLHARKVPGAHVVLRLPNRDAQPDRRAIQAAAGVAAYYSKARTSQLVPVMVTERKYVRSPSGAPPGVVRVEREEVVMAEPRLPAGR